MCGLTNASTKVVTARSYSRYSGSTTQDSDSVQSGYSCAKISASRRSWAGLAYECMRQMPIARTPCLRKKCAAARARFVQRPDLLTAEVQPSADFADEMERHDALRFHPEVRIAVTFRHGLTRDLQEMAEACSDDEAESADWTLQQRVCGNGCAVGEAGDLGRRLVDC